MGGGVQKYGMRVSKIWEESFKNMGGGFQKYGRRGSKIWEEGFKNMGGGVQKYERRRYKKWNAFCQIIWTKWNALYIKYPAQNLITT